MSQGIYEQKCDHLSDKEMYEKVVSGEVSLVDFRDWMSGQRSKVMLESFEMGRKSQGEVK